MSGRVPAIRVLLVDDQRVLREALATLLGLLEGIEVVGVAADGDEAVEAYLRSRPDVVLMDLHMPRCDGVQATARIRAQDAEARVIALTTYADDRWLLGALRAGARGFLTKDAGAEEIRDALEAVMRGRAIIDPAVQHHLIEAVAAARNPGSPAASAPALPDGLTRREAEVLGLIAEGLSNAEIAARLVVSEATIKSHVNHIFAKIGARDRAQAVAYAYRNGLVARL